MKFHGKIGFWVGDAETSPGVWEPQIVEKKYTGDILRNRRNFQQSSDQINNNLTISNQFSILSDLYLRENLDSVQYLEWNGAKWSISNIDIDYPRINLTVGGVYHGETKT